MNASNRTFLVFALGLSLAACSGEQASQQAPAPATSGPAAVNAARIEGADSEPGNWMTIGRTYDGQRYSPLNQINSGNVGQLSLAWHYDISDGKHGQEATPVVVDGVMYVSTDMSRVKAIDAKTGKEIWAFDPEVDGGWLLHICCGFVNRGVAVWDGKVYVGTLDGRLIAIDAKDGKQIWSVQTTDRSRAYAITGAPIVVKGKVIIGNAGAEYDVRGYITAYDAETGDQDWRFYTVPGNPADGFENDAMDMAAKTWTGDWWTNGGGATVWSSFSYDPELNLIYFGTGNGLEWARSKRSPEGGDNLFVSSILALNPDTGEYVWHYQEVPGDEWDFDSCQNVILTNLTIDGMERKVLLHAQKNGFFFVLDRTTGKPISIEPFETTNWATGYDMTTGRPIFTKDARYDTRGKPTLIIPGPSGAHNWHPMAYSPDTGLVYIPAQTSSSTFAMDPHYVRKKLTANIGILFEPVTALDDNGKALTPPEVTGYLLAWDPVRQKEAWRAPHTKSNNGGVLTTAGNLVVEGTAEGNVEIYRADSGELLWSSPAQSGVVASPASYEIDGEQYIAVSVGWGGAAALGMPSGVPVNVNRVLAFKLGGTDKLPAQPMAPERELNPPAQTGTPQSIEAGMHIYHRYCGGCHGFGVQAAQLTPDLRYSATLDNDLWFSVVADGALQSAGMGAFGSELSHDDLSAIRDYVISRANAAKKDQ
jgi:quinohemoprotein ethanol dehydrogenase